MKTTSGFPILIFILIFGAGIAIAYSQFAAANEILSGAIAVASLIAGSIAASATKIAS
jgi:hypothetical protein